MQERIKKKSTLADRNVPCKIKLLSLLTCGIRSNFIKQTQIQFSLETFCHLKHNVKTLYVSSILMIKTLKYTFELISNLSESIEKKWRYQFTYSCVPLIAHNYLQCYNCCYNYHIIKISLFSSLFTLYPISSNVSITEL